jgi:hypothetical protein
MRMIGVLSLFAKGRLETVIDWDYGDLRAIRESVKAGERMPELPEGL